MLSRGSQYADFGMEVRQIWTRVDPGFFLRISHLPGNLLCLPNFFPAFSWPDSQHSPLAFKDLDQDLEQSLLCTYPNHCTHHSTPQCLLTSLFIILGHEFLEEELCLFHHFNNGVLLVFSIQETGKVSDVLLLKKSVVLKINGKKHTQMVSYIIKG